jgi:cytochrome c oxidase subunit IV
MQHAAVSDHQEGQQHPLGVYLKIWLLLFVLSACSYMVDYFHLHSYLRWSLVLTFMLLKAGLIVAIFMHMRWERLALIYTILIPPLCLLILIGMMAIEADYTLGHRKTYFDKPVPITAHKPHAVSTDEANKQQ